MLIRPAITRILDRALAHYHKKQYTNALLVLANTDLIELNIEEKASVANVRYLIQLTIEKAHNNT